MSVQRFVGKSSTAVLKEVRASLGNDAVIISNRTTGSGVEVVAMAGNEMDHLIENANTAVSQPSARLSKRIENDDRGAPPAFRGKQAHRQADEDTVAQANPMLLGQPETFEAYLKRARGKQLNAKSTEVSTRPSLLAKPQRNARAAAEYESVFAAQMDDPEPLPGMPSYAQEQSAHKPSRIASAGVNQPITRADETHNTRASALSPMAGETPAAPAMPEQSVVAANRSVPHSPVAESAMMSELRSMRGMLQNQLAHFAFADMSRKNPVQGKILAKMLQAGFSPALTRALTEKITVGVNETVAEEWLAKALCQNLRCAKVGEDMVDRGGVYALVGPTGVGKTTTSAKLAARCAVKYGVKKLGLITIDGYRMGAQDQLKSFGKILGCPVHVAHDQAGLNDILLAMRDRHLVLIDTVGMPQRDSRMAEQMSMLMAPGIERVMVLNAASQAETLEDVVQVWSGPRCRRALITKLDEAVKLGGVVDAAIRHQLMIDYVTNGQRVPEDIHGAVADLLVRRALRAETSPVFQFNSDELAVMAVPSSEEHKIKYA